MLFNCFIQTGNRAIPDAERSGLDKFFKIGLQNAAPYTIDTENARYGFFKLNNPRIIEENRRYFILNFNNETVSFVRPNSPTASVMLLMI